MSGRPSGVRGGLKVLVFGSAHSWNFTGSSGHPAAVRGGACCADVGSADAASTRIAAAQETISDGFIGDLLGRLKAGPPYDRESYARSRGRPWRSGALSSNHRGYASVA